MGKQWFVSSYLIIDVTKTRVFFYHCFTSQYLQHDLVKMGKTKRTFELICNDNEYVKFKKPKNFKNCQKIDEDNPPMIEEEEDYLIVKLRTPLKT